MLTPLTLDHDEIRRLDAELVRLSRTSVVDRLTLGVALHRLGRRFRELGFRTFAMYVRERASQSARWCGDTRALARRLEERPRLREALVHGRIGWTMAELLARHSTPEDEGERLDAAASMTVREVRDALRAAGHEEAEESEEAFSTIDLTVTSTELLALEGTRVAVDHVNGGVVEPGHWLECLLFEGASTLFGGRPDLAAHYDAVEPPTLRSGTSLVEETAPPPDDDDGLDGEVGDGMREEVVDTDDPVALDAIVREVSARIASRDLWLGELLSRFLLARGWLQLGYASEQSYFDERLGLARSTARGRVTLARRMPGLEPLRDAVIQGDVGYEQAALIARVAGPDTTAAWIARAKARTFKHLAEEVRAAELLARVGGDAPRRLEPPDADEVEAVIEFERGVLSGETIARALRDDPTEEPVQMSGGSAVQERRCCFPVRARDEVILDFRRLEAVHRQSGLPGSFVTFLVVSLWSAWGERFFEGNRWKALHDRDRHRCVSPVCESRNCTNHHLRYRGHGGGDEDENQITLCEFCHLDGEHGGRLRVRGTASRPVWSIGRTPVMRVEGREVVLR
ncbi:MAG: hypothetical protein H6719_28115 [Sandaracinaceae bacterium]|nr:hypothetical protein [Sandaracinaceae bacterium]